MNGEPIAIIAVLLLVIKELITYLKNRKEPAWDGVSERRGATISEVDNSLKLYVIPIMNQQTSILSELEKLDRGNSERLTEMKFGVASIKDDTERLRNSLHNIIASQQTIANEVHNLKRGN